jgi:hypothetical protein
VHSNQGHHVNTEDWLTTWKLFSCYQMWLVCCN